MNFRRLVWVALLFAGTHAASAMTVEEAYKAIPHGRTVFKPNEAKMDPDEARRLVVLFDWVDRAIVEKVEISHLKRPWRSPDHYDELVKEINRFHTGSKYFLDIRDLVIRAAQDQRDALREWQKQNPQPVALTLQGNAKVMSASQKLHEAYSKLLSAYPAENAHNKQAFFDYLCALDFL